MKCFTGSLKTTIPEEFAKTTAVMVLALCSLRNEFNFITGATAKNDFTLKISCASSGQYAKLSP
jgi:hypothetical protein